MDLGWPLRLIVRLLRDRERSLEVSLTARASRRGLFDPSRTDAGVADAAFEMAVARRLPRAGLEHPFLLRSDAGDG